MKALLLALLALVATAQLTTAQTQTYYEKCIADAETAAEQTKCALTND